MSEPEKFKVILLPGMSPGDWILYRLKSQFPDAYVVEWIAPEPNETIPNYAQRLAETIPEFAGKTLICGVSLGGIIARELAPHLTSVESVLIASIRDRSELPLRFRVFSAFTTSRFPIFLRTIGVVAERVSKLKFLSKLARLGKFNGEYGAWYRWATTAVLRWNLSPEAAALSANQIHGDKDGTFPVRCVSPDVVIEGGCHLISLTHSSEIADFIRKVAAAPIAGTNLQK